MTTLTMQRLKLNTCNAKDNATCKWGKNSYSTHWIIKDRQINNQKYRKS